MFLQLSNDTDSPHKPKSNLWLPVMNNGMLHTVHYARNEARSFGPFLLDESIGPLDDGNMYKMAVNLETMLAIKKTNVEARVGSDRYRKQL